MTEKAEIIKKLMCSDVVEDKLIAISLIDEDIMAELPRMHLIQWSGYYDNKFRTYRDENNNDIWDIITEKYKDHIYV